MTAERRAGPIVTLDGPAGSGKSSTARAVAAELGFRHLDSGALYRALTYALLDRGIAPDRWPELTRADFTALGVETRCDDDGHPAIFVGGDFIPDERLRTPLVNRHVSRVAELEAVRGALLDLQRQAGRAGRLVADGRDMGTVVFPDAEVKVYLVADLHERARRRLLERTGGAAESPATDAIADEAVSIAERDRIDAGREVAPLKPAPDAWELDTTGLSFDEQVAAIVERVRGVERGSVR